MDADRPIKLGGRVMARAVVATRSRVDDCLAESREVLSRPRVPPRVWKEYLSNPDVMAIRKTLVDMRKANILFTGDEFSKLIKRVAIPGLAGKDWKSAIIVERPHQYGVCRQFQVFAECYSKNAIFYEYDSALQWLRQQ